MKKQYNVVVTERKSMARSKRLRESGQSSSGTVISVLGGNSGGSGNAGDGHTHENLLTLNRIKTDKEDYLTLRTSELDEETGAVTTSDKRAKVGYADEAGHAVNADNATHADNAIHADKAHDVDDDSPVYDKVLRKDRSDRTDHSLDIGGDLIVGGFENVLGGLEVKGGFSVDTADASGDITGCNLKAVETISGTDVTVLETISGKNITATETVSAQNVDATGTISANMIDTTETISGKNILASEGVAGENVTASNSVSGKNVTAKETVSGKNVTVSGKVTTLNLLVQSLANTYDLNVSHVATLFQTVVKDYISSELYTPGLTGSGMKLYKAVSGDWNLELDNVTVRKAMTIFELIISKIRAVNGGLVISPANGKVKSVLLTNDIYRLEIEGDMMFVADDLVRCQTFTKTGTKYYWVRITSVSGQYILINKTEFAKSVPAVGDELVQFGNKTDVARQGILYLTASEDGKPRFSVLDGVNSTDLTGKTKVILGCLDGITDTDFLTDFQPSGYGLYSENVFLKGIFVLKSGKKIEEFINDGIASVQVGGRNLLANSDFSENSLSKWRGSQDNNYTLSIENSELKIVGQQGRTSAELNNSWNTAWYVAPYSFNVAGDYTISFDAYALKACTLYFRANYFTHPTYGGSVQIGTKKQRYSLYSRMIQMKILAY